MTAPPLIERQPWRALIQVALALFWTIAATFFPGLGWSAAFICIIVAVLSRWSNGPYDDISPVAFVAAALAAVGAIVGDHLDLWNVAVHR